MAKLVEVVEPREKEYIFKFTQSEVDMLAGILNDLTDTGRKVAMDYPLDDSRVVPSVKGLRILKRLKDALDEPTHSADYDYFDLWNETEN